MKYVKKSIKKAYKKGTRSLKKAYFKGKGYSRPRLGRMARQVASLATMINAEKKRLDIVSALNPVGQCNGNSSAYYINDITPIAVEGTGFQQRTGSSIKLHSMHMQLQFIQQANTSQPIKFKIMFIQVKGAPQGLTSFVTGMYNLNNFVLNSGSTAIIDYDSMRNPDFFPGYRVLQTKTVTLPVDTYSTALQVRTLNLGHMFGKGMHIRYSGDSNVVANSQLIILVLASSGNINNSTSSTLTGIPTGAVSTGALFSYDLKYYYYDN